MPPYNPSSLIYQAWEGIIIMWKGDFFVIRNYLLFIAKGSSSSFVIVRFYFFLPFLSCLAPPHSKNMIGGR